jgi:hypothetical protein
MMPTSLVGSQCRRCPDLTAWLDQVQALWTDQLGALREHVEHLSKGEAE